MEKGSEKLTFEVKERERRKMIPIEDRIIAKDRNTTLQEYFSMITVKKWLTILVALGFLFGAPLWSQAKTVNEKILDILLESKIVTEEKFQELKKQVEMEEAEVAKLKVAAEKKPTEGARVDFKRGFSIESADGENKLNLSGRFNGDYRLYLGDSPNNDTFLIRRARLSMKGTLYKYYEFTVDADFSQGTPQLYEALLNINYVPYSQLMFGQFKIPFGLEQLTSTNNMAFVENSLADNFPPGYDQGLMFHGNISNDLLYYQLGVFNGRKTNVSSDVDDEKDFGGRITLAPFSKMEIPIIKDFHIGGAFTSGVEHTTKPSTDWWKNSFKTPGQTTFLQFDDTVRQDGTRNRLGAELAWLVGPVSLKSEYMTLQLNDLTKGKTRGSFSGNAGYVSLGWLITGENEPWKNGLPAAITPKNPFVFGKGGRGAFQILARYDWLDMDKGLLEKGFVDPTKYTNKASGYAFGLTWYPNDMVRFMVNYFHTDFGNDIDVSGKKMGSEDAVFTRFQIVW
jgi:phosphate-selective porin OprO and OprP